MSRPAVLFVCGSINQTTQMERIADALPGVEARFTSYVPTRGLSLLDRLGFLEHSIAGRRLRRRCLDHLRANRRTLDDGIHRDDYALVVTCSDQIVQEPLRDHPVVLVQEGILDPPNGLQGLARRFPRFPRWMARTAATGQSRAYRRFCVASAGYRDWFAGQGLDPGRLVVTGIPNFDDCEAYRDNDLPLRDYVLVCTSDARETGKRDDRAGFLRRVVDIAAGRPLVFKLHPNERADRARREIAAAAPGAPVLVEESAEELVANARAVVCQYSTLIFVAVALGKECYSYFDLDEVRRLLPEQNRRAAGNIADVVRGVLAAEGVALPAPREEPAPEGEPLPGNEEVPCASSS